MVQVILSAGKCHYNTMKSILGLCKAYRHSDLTEASDNISTVCGSHSQDGCSEELIILKILVFYRAENPCHSSEYKKWSYS